MKLATLLFSGGVAAVAIARAGLAGCDGPAQAPAKAAPVVAPAVAPVAAPVATPAEPVVPAVAEPVVTVPVVAAPDAAPTVGGKAGPAKAAGVPAAGANAANAPELPARYLGGSKSDVDVWGGLPAEEAAPTKPAKGGGK